jgi:hypothetical protein
MNVLQQQKGGGHGALSHILGEMSGNSGLKISCASVVSAPLLTLKGNRPDCMRGFKEKGFNDRLEAAAKAKQAQLERARAKSPLNDPDFARRQAERKRQAEEREARIAARAAEKAADAQRDAERRAADEAARIAAEKLAEEERLKAGREEADRLVALAAEQKAARDARYAARKQRKR